MAHCIYYATGALGDEHDFIASIRIRMSAFSWSGAYDHYESQRSSLQCGPIQGKKPRELSKKGNLREAYSYTYKYVCIRRHGGLYLNGVPEVLRCTPRFVSSSSSSRGMNSYVPVLIRVELHFTHGTHMFWMNAFQTPEATAAPRVVPSSPFSDKAKHYIRL